MANQKISCTNIEIEQIRARVVINGTFIVETPYVKSFSVNRSRTSNIATFSASIEIPVTADLSFGSSNGGYIVIYAGTKENYLERKIITGIIRQITPNPVPGKPNYFMISISGKDIMYKLENKKYSRRLETEGPGVFVTIESSKTQRPSAGWSIDKRVRGGSNQYNSPSPSLYDRSAHNDLTKTRDFSQVPKNWNGPLSEISPEPGRGGSGNLTVHSHDTLGRGGPAFGVYSIS
jgi:hypothetical protein